MHTHITHAPDAAHLDYLHTILHPALTITTGDEIDPQTHILIAGRPSREQLDALPHLHTLIIPFAGLPAVTRDLMRDYPNIAIHNLHHNAPTTAEMALALMFATAKHLLPADRAFRQHDWRPRYEAMPNTILHGKSVLILGYGAIGQRVGAVCAALDMHVTGVRRNPDPANHVYTPDHLPHLLSSTHVLICCLPGTPETEGMIGADELALLPPGGLVVNVGRAAVIDQHALYAALKSGHLAGAGIDVWYSYPPDVESRAQHPPAAVPFHTLENIVMSPHRAGGLAVHELELRRMDALATLLNAAANGAPLPHKMDLARGY